MQKLYVADVLRAVGASVSCGFRSSTINSLLPQGGLRDNAHWDKAKDLRAVQTKQYEVHSRIAARRLITRDPVHTSSRQLQIEEGAKESRKLQRLCFKPRRLPSKQVTTACLHCNIFQRAHVAENRTLYMTILLMHGSCTPIR